MKKSLSKEILIALQIKNLFPKFSKEIQEARSNRGKFCFGHCGWMGRQDQGFMWISLPTISTTWTTSSVSTTAILDGEHDSWGFFFQKISSHKSKLCPHWKKGMLGAWTRIYENRPKPGYGQQGLKDGILGPRFNSGGKNSGFSQQKHHTFSFLTGSQLTINRCGEHDLCGFLILTLSTSKPRIYVDLSSGRGKIIFITILVIAIVYSVAVYKTSTTFYLLAQWHNRQRAVLFFETLSPQIYVRDLISGETCICKRGYFHNLISWG